MAYNLLIVKKGKRWEGLVEIGWSKVAPFLLQQGGGKEIIVLSFSLIIF